MLKIIVCFLLLISGGLLQLDIDKERQRYAASHDSTIFSTPQSLLANILGESRTLIADVLWIKVDEYFHTHQPGKVHGQEKEHREDEGHSEEVGVTEIMPLIRLITWLDPHFIKAYRVGGWHLSFNLNRVEEGKKFLKEGINNNPSRYELYYDLGWVYFTIERDYINAARYLEEARARRVEDKYEHKSVLVMLASSYEKMNQMEKADLLWREAARVDPADPIIRERLKTP